MHLESLFAYIDPMSGTIVVQVIIAGTIGCFALFRKTIARSVSWLTGRRAQSAQSDGDNLAKPSQRKAA